MNRNYMVIRPETSGNEKYTLRMLNGNHIQGLLPFQDKMVNGEVKYYYDITSKQPLNRILEHRTMSGAELRTFVTELLFALRQMERFLLDESQLVFQPEYIYVDPGTMKATFCLVPGLHHEFADEFCSLSQYLLDHVNQSDGDAVLLAFSIFKECRKLNFGMDDIEQCLRKSEPNGKWENYEHVEEKEEVKKIPKDDFDKKTGKVQENTIEKEKKQNLQPKDEQIQSASKVVMTGIIIFLGIAIIAFPIAIFAWKGMHGLFRWKWILLIVEIVLIIGLIVLLYLRSDELDVDLIEKERKRANVKKEDDQNDGLFGWSSFPDIKYSESSYEEEPWEVQLRDPKAKGEVKNAAVKREYEAQEKKFEEGEDEIQTVLLRARPVYKEGRKLVSVNDGTEILVGYFPFLIGKNRDITDHCLNKPGISRLHIKLEETENGYTVTDLNSTNGTSINGRLLEANETALLDLGDELMIAGERFYFR